MGPKQFLLPAAVALTLLASVWFQAKSEGTANRATGTEQGGTAMTGRTTTSAPRASSTRGTFHPSRIRGILPTVLTPYDDHEQIDVAALEAQVNYLVGAGVHCLLLMGSIGEAPYLSDLDREQVIGTVIETVRGKVPIMVGIAAESTFVAAQQIRQADRLGADAVMVCLPQYFQLEFEDAKRHFSRLSELNLLPIFYYNYPAATRLNLTPGQIAELLTIPNVVGIKESTFDMRSIKQHIELTRGMDRIFLSGSELNFVQFMDLGGHGAVSAGGVVMPRTAVAMYEAYAARDRTRAQQLQSQMFETLPLLKKATLPVFLARQAFLEALRMGLAVPLGVESTQARLKAALAYRGIPIKPIARSPLPPLTTRDREAAEQVMKKVLRIEPAVRK